MRKFVLILGFYLVFSINAQAEDSVNNIAQNIYEECNRNIPSVTETQVVSGNIADVKRERALRECLKENIIEMSQLFMKKDEINNFKESLNKIESAFFSLYKSLIFCNDDVDDNWCKTRHYDDKSLSKLMLEKQITTQIYNILRNTIEAKQGGYVF